MTLNEGEPRRPGHPQALHGLAVDRRGEPDADRLCRQPGGTLLTLSQGMGVQLLRGDLKSKDRRESARTFNVGRGAIRSRLAITPTASKAHRTKSSTA